MRPTGAAAFSPLGPLGLLVVAAAALGWLLIAGSGGAHAAAPEPWQMTLQPAASPTMERMSTMHDWVTALMIGVALLVLVLLAIIVVRFNAKANPTPSTRAHNTPLEVLWTAIPILILAVIAYPSLSLLYYVDRAKDADMTLKVVGHQWYWSYEYPDNGDFSFDSFMVYDGSLEKGQKRLLEVDKRIVLPVDTTVRLLITSTDVIHAFAVPSLGLKLDAVPGRLNETWVSVEREGVYYGQCSELCGVNHGFMPIAIEAVSKEAFREWAANAAKEYARSDDAPVTGAVEVAAGGPAAQGTAD